MTKSKVLAYASFMNFLGLAQAQNGGIPVSSAPVNASNPLPEAFVSFSIEFASFPDYAGNKSSPNEFSYNLLKNIGKIVGTNPYIRVGGNTQDYALYNPSLPYALNGTFDFARSKDYPTTIFIGPSYFESYQTWPDTKFIHGFNLGLGGNNSAGWETLLETVPLACEAIGNNLLYWEYGNEPDLYSTSSQGPVRPSTWDEPTVEKKLSANGEAKTYGYLAPSFAGTNNHLKEYKTWAANIDSDDNIRLISSHNYIGGATQPGVTLQGTLMNHSITVKSISGQLAVAANLSSYHLPFILGETNSLYNEGAPGLSNSFGAALWGVDFNLWCASQNIARVHMHQGLNYRYASWQPAQTNITTIGTKPPYYGNIAVAAMLGNLLEHDVQIANLPLESDMESAYAAYEDGALARIAVVNMRQYNYTVNGTSDVQNPVRRPVQTYTFQLDEGYNGATIQRLYANGSDAITGITWDGKSYNYELDFGMEVRLGNVTTGEKVEVIDGNVVVLVEDSTAVILTMLKENGT